MAADSAAGTRLFFDSYGSTPLEFSAVEVDAAIAFFTARGFSLDSAMATALMILKQARLEQKPVFTVLDTLKNIDSAELNSIIAKILNQSADATSVVGYRAAKNVPPVIARNIVP